MSECPFPLDALISGYTAGLLTATAFTLILLVIYRIGNGEDR